MSTEESPSGFLDAWARLVGPRGVPTVAARRGRKPRVPITQVLPALTFHVMQDAGTLAEHLFQLFRTPLADSSWSDRRLRLPWEIFAELMRRALRPRATPRQHRDGVLARLAPGRPRWHAVQSDQYAAGDGDTSRKRGRAGAVRPSPRSPPRSCWKSGCTIRWPPAIGRQRRIRVGAGAAAAGAVAEAGLVAGRSLVWRDGVCRVAHAACQRVGSHFLLRASRTVKPRLIRRLRDGSRLVGWRCGPAQSEPHRRVARGARDSRAGRPARRTARTNCGCGPVCAIRGTAPALELAQVYASRWEHELYFREIKRQLRRTAVLAESHGGNRRARNRRAGVGQCRHRRRTRACGHRPRSRRLRVSFGQVLQHRPRHVAVPRAVRRRLDRPAEDPRRSPRPGAHPPQRAGARRGHALVRAPCASR